MDLLQTLNSLMGPVDGKWLAGAVGLVLSLTLSYVKPIRIRWDTIDGDSKRLIMGGAVVVLAAILWGLSCAVPIAGVTCSSSGAAGLLQYIGTALAINQTTYSISPTPGFAKSSSAKAGAARAVSTKK